MILEIIFKCILAASCIVGFVATAIFVECVVLPKLKEIRNRQSKVRCLCKHEYVKKCVWTKFEHEYSKTNICKEMDLQCRKCGKKKTIKIYEEDE